MDAKLSEPRTAAELASAGAEATDHAGLVTGADLTHLDPRMEPLRQVPNEGAKIDALLGREVEHGLAAIESVVDPDQTQVEPHVTAHLGEDLLGLSLLAAIVVGAVQVSDDDEIMLISSGGTLVRTSVREISVLSRNTQGVRLIRLDSGETVAEVERVAALNGDDEDDVDEPEGSPTLH